MSPQQVTKVITQDERIKYTSIGILGLLFILVVIPWASFGTLGAIVSVTVVSFWYFARLDRKRRRVEVQRVNY